MVKDKDRLYMVSVEDKDGLYMVSVKDKDRLFVSMASGVREGVRRLDQYINQLVSLPVGVGSSVAY